MRAGAALSSAFLPLLAATPALAQGGVAPPGTFAPRSEIVTQASLSMRVARCALKQDRKAAEAFAAAADEQASRRAFSKLVKALDPCIQGGSATLSNVHMTGAIAGELLRENNGAMLDQLAAMPPRAPIRVAEGEGSSREAVNCAVAGAPADAATLLRAPAESPAEIAAFRAMVPALQACVPATGGVTLKPSIVRVAIATAAYQQVKGATAPAGTN